ncbi:helix-turn-helix domain-containing protein [Gordonia rhizosphera]|uniref:Putative Xre family DNA binding protein n=1 Tax=Gordonia rhizosphera NBRC 16068 TaxID=1108045 RepID=K6VBU1_9ACTN|nr:helix-turn-helix transcriptional regulator [Gordonia rhizosphera]GAB93683.1 putative Xre family DNA binding protein [Gordonia rhizosphera NBRC 16068]
MDERRSTSASGPRDAEPLLREVTGRVLRRHRHERGERLVETARRAGVSSQYLSEMERGRKDASSELLAAVAGALGLTLFDLTREVGGELARATLVSVPRMSGPPTSVVVPMRGLRGPVALAA